MATPRRAKHLPANDPAPTAAPPAAASSAARAASPAQRHDGWTPERQRVFLTALADGHTVEAACALAGPSVASAYALRRRPAGAAFALGWRAACLLARDALADVLMRRVIDGQVDTYVRANGETVTRHRYDNRLAAAMLTRLDRLADAPLTVAPARTGAAADDAPGAGALDAATAARLAAADWDRCVDLVGADDPAAAAARFIVAAADAADTNAKDTNGTPEVPQLRPAAARGRLALVPAERPPVFFSKGRNAWATRFPPPPGFHEDESGRYGDADYMRALTPREQAVQDRGLAAGMAEQTARETAERDTWFGFAPDLAGFGDLPPELFGDAPVAAPAAPEAPPPAA